MIKLSGKVKLCCNIKYCYNVLIFSKGPPKFSYAKGEKQKKGKIPLGQNIDYQNIDKSFLDTFVTKIGWTKIRTRRKSLHEFTATKKASVL